MNKNNDLDDEALSCCQKWCSSNFGNDISKSITPVSQEATNYQLNKHLEMRGRWSNRIEFLLSCIGLVVQLGNVWRFPIKVYYGGGGAFLLPYMFLSVILGIPLLLLEMGLGQFSGRSPVKAFKLVPVLYGIGWCMFIANILICIYYGVIMSWCYFYLFGSFSYIMPWTVCDHVYNTDNCLASLDDQLVTNKSVSYVSSTSEYWDYHVTGFKKYPSREVYRMNENPGGPQGQLIICLLIVWAVAASALMFGVRISGKIIYFSALFPYVAIIVLIIVGCRLPGGYNGVSYYLTPNWSKMFNAEIFRGVIEQLLYSCNIGMGGMITFSSYNHFGDNIYRDAIIVVFADFLTSILAGFAVFQILGYMANRNGVPIENVITSESSLFFITYPEALATLPLPNMWTLFFMILAISLGMDSQFAMLETVISSLVDVFPKLRKSKKKKVICVWIVCFCFFLSGILLCTPGGQYYFSIIDLRVSSYGLPILALLETITVGLIYGISQFKYDYQMMLGFSLSWYWFIMMAFTCPIIILIVLIASFVRYERISVAGEYIPIWGELLSFFFLTILLSPLFICSIHTIINYNKKYPKLKGIFFLEKLFATPIYWGPLYLKHWLLSSFYRKKYLMNKDDPRFLKYVHKFENMAYITKMAHSNSPTFVFISADEF